MMRSRYYRILAPLAVFTMLLRSMKPFDYLYQTANRLSTFARMSLIYLTYHSLRVTWRIRPNGLLKRDLLNNISTLVYVDYIFNEIVITENHLFQLEDRNGATGWLQPPTFVSQWLSNQTCFRLHGSMTARH